MMRNWNASTVTTVSGMDRAGKEIVMKKFGYILLVVLAAAATVGGLLLKENIATRKAEGKQVEIGRAHV